MLPHLGYTVTVKPTIKDGETDSTGGETLRLIDTVVELKSWACTSR